MPIAIIDLGTNTFHLLIADILPDGKFKTRFKIKTAVKLGEGGITKKFISPKAFQRGIEALVHFKKRIDEFKAEKVHAFATAAVRQASNGNEFIREINNRTGISVKTISGLKEAELIYYGVRQAVKMKEEKSLIMDIGGGSVEFIIADGKKILWKNSYPLGGALLLEKITPSDPFKKTEIKAIETYAGKLLNDLFTACSNWKPERLIGSSGSFDTFAALIANRYFTTDILKRRKSWLFNMKHYNQVQKELLVSTTEERKKMKGMIAMRVDMIVLATVLLNFVLKRTGISQLYLSTFALKEGILWAVVNGKI